MATTNNDAIQKLYVAYFNRPADPAGLAFWAGNVGADGDTSAIAAAFATTPEYTATFNGMTNAQIVAAVYQNLFGRAADAEGAAFWTAALDANTITVDNVVTSVAAGAQGTDSTIVTNKVAAASAFTAAIDTPVEISGYAGVGANAAAKTWLSTVTDAASLTAALDPATLATTVANVVAAGTSFSVAGALGALNQANADLAAFLKATDLDDNAATPTTETAIGAAKTAAIATVADDLTGGATGSTGALFISTTSESVRDALISAQQTVNNANLATAQQLVTADNAAIAKVAGLSAAITNLTSANTALSAAQKAEVTANADVTAKVAGFGVANAADGAFNPTVDAAGHVTALSFTPTGGTATDLVTINASGNATIATGVNASDYVGLTELIASINADANAVSTVTKAEANVYTATLGVSILDINDTGTIATIGGTTYTETTLLKAIADQINTTTSGTVAAGAQPTLAQIQTELAVLKAAGASGSATYDSFKALVDAEVNAASTFNPLASQLATHTGAVTAVNDVMKDLATDVAAMQEANTTAGTLAAYQATITADTKMLTDKGYSVVTLDAAHSGTATQFAGANSDVYVLNGNDATIAAFGLQGSDSLFVGTGYTLVNGAIGATGVTANNAALEVFVSTTTGGDTLLQIETHAYSSSVGGTGTGEVINITLTGVDAASLHLSTDGIITTGTTATA